MSPFVQELVSFISILAGVITLTSWVMWILLRPSGDSKVKDFAEKSAKDGLTRCVMENNELKNTIKRLERENKVLMSAGYGKKSEEKVEPKEGERLQVRPEERQEKEKEKSLESKIERPTIKEQAEPQVKKERVEEERGVEVSKDSDQGPGIKEEVIEVEEQTGLRDANSTDIEPEPAKPVVQESLDLEPEPAPQKVIDEAEKKKIAEYMASVEKETERQKKEIEKIESWKKSDSFEDDDLKQIRGVGPHIEKMLKKAGITSFRQISKFSDEDIRLVSDAIGSFPRRIKREQWVEQAKALLGKG